MSVLVKGMEMPRNCYECKVWFECFDEKPPFNMIKSVCPLIEIPTPHGRLIDADELANKTFYSKTSAPYITYKTFVDAPTVIEPEGSEE